MDSGLSGRGWMVVTAAITVTLLAVLGATDTAAEPRSFPGRAGKIVFVRISANSRASDLYLISPSGKNGTRLTRSLLKERNPVWAPTGRLIAFERERTRTPAPPTSTPCS